MFNQKLCKMKTTEITTKNFDDFIQTTIDSQDTERGTYYLDSHLKNGKYYFTVSKDENVMNCYDDESEAKDYFYEMIGEE